MGYRIDYRLDSGVRGSVLCAIVSGKSSFARSIARDIGEQAQSAAAGDLLIDLRKLDDRIGSLSTILATGGGPALADRRIAVLDVLENDGYYVFAERFARALGCTLRCFNDPRDAINWLSEEVF